ncbi:MAG: PilZ domain-containing protein [Bradymonadaceae bacterium]
MSSEQQGVGDEDSTSTSISGPKYRRSHKRVPINQEFKCIEDYISEYVTDISKGGVFIRSKNPLPVGTTVTLHFSVIVEDIETIEGEGEVIRVDMSSDNMGMGIAFKKLTSGSKELIDRIIKLHHAGDL